MAAELSNQVYTAPQAPDYLGHYADLLRSIPNYGKQFAEAQIQAAQLQQAQAQFELMKQKAKAFTELYPAWKAAEMDRYRAQADKLRAEAGTFPFRQALLQEQAALARARTAGLNPPADNADPTAGAARPMRPGSVPGGAAAINAFVPVPGLPRDPLQPAPETVPLPVAVSESDVPPTGLTTTE